MASRRRHTPLRTSKQDIAAMKRAPQTPQTASAAYRLAYTDEEFLTSDDTRGIRFQLEYLKSEFRLRERGINSTVVLFGGARIPEPGKAAGAARNETQKTNLEIASKYYEEARLYLDRAKSNGFFGGMRDAEMYQPSTFKELIQSYGGDQPADAASHGCGCGGSH